MEPVNGEGSKSSLWATLLAETSKKSKITDASAFILGGNRTLKSNLCMKLSGWTYESKPPSTSCVDFIESYGYFEITDEASDSDLGKFNVWSVENSGLTDIIDITSCNSTNISRNLFIIAIDATSAATEALEAVILALRNVLETMTILKLKALDQILEAESSFVRYLCDVRYASQTITATHFDCIQKELKFNFGFPIITVLTTTESTTASMSHELRKSTKDLQSILRNSCLQFGGALLDCNLSDNASVERLRKYILHRLHPEIIRMDLSIEQTPGSCFIPSGLDSRELLSVSSSSNGDVSLDIVRPVQIVTSTKADTQDDTLKSEIDNEEEWLTSLLQFIKQASETASGPLPATSMSSTLEKPVRRSTELSSTLSNPTPATTAAGSKPRRVSVVGSTAQNDQDVNSFFQNLLVQKK